MTEEPLDQWEGATAAELAARWGVPVVHLYRRVGSTNDVARRLAAQGAPAGTAVLAEEQLAGRGRAGRAWSSPPGLGLWLSVVARPTNIEELGLLPILVGLQTAEALDAFLPAGRVCLKWPNDLLVGGRKLGGILCEATWKGDHPSAVVVGLGLNVVHGHTDFPESLRDAATSLRLAAAGEVSRAEVAAAIIAPLRRRLAGPLKLEPGEAEALAGRDVLHGHEVDVTDPLSGASLASGHAVGIAPDGALLLRLAGDGARREIRSGTVRFRST